MNSEIEETKKVFYQYCREQHPGTSISDTVIEHYTKISNNFDSFSAGWEASRKVPHRQCDGCREVHSVVKKKVHKGGQTA